MAAPDEDPFTLVATALERAFEGLERPAGPVHVEWLGGSSPAMDWAVPVVLGSVAEVVRSPANALALKEAVARAEGAADGFSVVVGSEIAGSPSPPDARPGAGPSHDGGFALLFAPDDGSAGSEVSRRLPEEPRPLDAVAALPRTLGAGTRAPEWIGDWHEAELPARALAAEPKALPDRLSSVSEGAYVPRARYLEHLPSRWRFTAERCGACQSLTFPTRGRCRACGRTEGLLTQDLPRDGAVVVATTVIGRGGQPTEFDPWVETLGSYGVVLAELAPGARVPLQVSDAVPGEIRIGDRVDTRLRRLYAMEGEWRYGRKAVPARARPAPAS